MPGVGGDVMRGGAKNIDYSKVESLYDPNASDKVNAKNMHISRVSFLKWRHTRGVPSCRELRGNIDNDEFYRLYNLGWSDRRIAKELKTQTQNIYYYRKKHGIPTNHPGVGRPAGELVDSMIELTDDDKPWKDPESLYCDKVFLEKFKVGNFEV